MPPWETCPKPTWPTKLTFFPNGKIRRVALFSINFNPRATFKFFQIDLAESAVGREASDIKVDAITRLVGEAFIIEHFDQTNLFADIIAGPGPVGRRHDSEFFHIVHKSLDIFVAEFSHPFKADGECFALETFHHFILALITIIGQVTKVSKVYGVLHQVAVSKQRALQHIRKNIRTKVAYMGIVVHGWPTAIDLYLRVFKRRKHLQSASLGIE